MQAYLSQLVVRLLDADLARLIAKLQAWKAKIEPEPDRALGFQSPRRLP